MAEAASVPVEGNEPAEVEESTELFTSCREMAKNSFLLTLHREFPLHADMLGDNRGQQWFFANINMDSWAEAEGLTVAELRDVIKRAKRDYHKERATDINRDRTLKNNLHEGLEMWEIKTVADLHKKLASISETEKELAALKEAKADTLAVAQLHKQMMADQGRMAAEYKAKVEAAVEAKVQPEIERQMEEKKVILDSKIAHHEKMAEWAIEGQAKNKAKQAL